MRTLIVAAIFTASLSVCEGSIYYDIPDPLPPNVSSLPYQTTGTSEFGGMVTTTAPLPIASATVIMSNWATESAFEAFGTSPGYFVPLTLNLYDVGPSDTVGALLYTATVNAFIQWRPEDDPSCPGGNWLAGDGNCYSGISQAVTFAIPLVTMPQTFIYGIAFNTQNSGYAPTGVNGPYNLLNIGLNTAPPSVGTNPLPDTAYWNTTIAANYTDGGATGVGIFRQDTNWSPFSGAISFDAAPEPSTIGLASLGIIGLLFFGKKRAYNSSDTK
jgi:PEP-CTERM motif